MLTYEAAAKWLNENRGVVGLALFIATLAFGWLSGIFAALRRRPKFKLRLIPGPTFCCTYSTGEVHKDYPVHRTAFALYLSVANVGSAASSIESVAVGYHCHLRPVSWQWVRFTLGWLWLRDQTAATHDFQAKIGENVKIYPFLTQSSILSAKTTRAFLLPGESTNGVVYFEQSDSWGGFFPLPGPKGVRIKVELRDTFGGSHFAKFKVDAVSLEHARSYNPSFGKTLAELRNQPLPHDVNR